MLNNRKAYEDKLEAQMEEWSADLARLKAKAKGAGAEGMIQLDRSLEAMKKGLAEAGAHLHNLKTAGDDTWEHVKAGTEKAWDELKAAFQHDPDRN